LHAISAEALVTEMASAPAETRTIVRKDLISILH
jgi:hypothetical protein